MLLCSRLVYFYVKSKKTCQSCSCSEVSPAQIHKYKSFPPASPRHVWTVERDPIYEDIIDVKNKVNSGESSVSNISKLSQQEKKSSVQYGVITAKEVAKFVPVSEVIIRR